MERLDEQWRKSSYSGGGSGGCVEVGQAHATVLVRDTKQDGDGQVHRFTPTAWRTFVAAIKRARGGVPS
jgi:hypothetical protein